MSLQKNTISRYRQLFPSETLREVSARTGIQITRVFRLFNGKTMKVGELEAFQTAITSKIAENPNSLKLEKLIAQALVVLTNEELGRINDFIERKVASKTYGRMYISPAYEDAIA